jgi:hypothetical protein
MTWVDFQSARQQLAEEVVGVPERIRQRADLAKVEQTKAAIRKSNGTS